MKRMMKKVGTFGGFLSAAVLLLSTAAMAAPDFMVNAATAGSDAFYRTATTPEGGFAGFGKAGDYAMAAKFDQYGRMEWAKAFTGVVHSNCNSGAAGSSGMFLVGRTGSSVLWVAKLAPWGRVLWQKEYTYGGYSSANLMGVCTAATSDGGCAISLRVNVDGSSGTYNYDQGLMKIASDGSLEWAKFYGTAAYDLAGEVIETKGLDGSPDGYLMVTQEENWGGVNLDNEVIAIKVGANGEKQWIGAYAGYDASSPAIPDGNEFVKGICQTADHGYAIVGSSYSASDPAWSSRRTPYILKVDSAGGKAWAKRFGVLSSDPGANGLAYGGVAQAADNSDLILGATYLNDAFWLLRFSGEGSLLEEATYPISANMPNMLGSVFATPDGGGVAAGWSKTYGAGDYDAFIMKFDANLAFSGTECGAGADPASEVADMRFDAQDVTANCHELDYTAKWSVANASAVEYDPSFWLWSCAADSDRDSDGVLDYLDNCPAASNSGQEDGDGDGYGNACDCDLDNDGSVAQADLLLLRGYWGTGQDAADFNSDGAVNQADLLMLRAKWGAAYPWY
ncbi:MAG: dockerin type I domain-containing protein [Syntrophobacteraceae bacterium]